MKLILPVLAFSCAALAFAQGDSRPPNFMNAQIVTPSVKGGATPGQVTLRLSFTDDIAGLASAMACFRSPSAKRIFCINFGTPQFVQGNALNGTIEASSTAPVFAELGIWTMWELELWDKAGNFRSVADLGLGFNIAASDPQPTIDQLTAMPQIAFGGDWETVLYFWNPYGTETTATVEFFEDSGTPLSIPTSSGTSSKVPVTIQGLNIATMKLPRGGPLVQGWLLTSLPSTVRGYAVFRQIVEGREEKEATVSFNRNMTSAYTFACDETEGFMTALSVANPNPVAISVNVQARDENTQTLGSKTVTLQPKSKQAFLLDGMNTAGRKYILKLETSGAVFAALGLRFTAAGSFTSIPAL